MVLSNLGYSLREAGRHFRRNWSTVLGAIVTIFLCLFVLGSALVGNMVGNVEDQVTIQAFLSDDASQGDVDALQAKIEGWGTVQSVTYKSKEEALEEYKQTMSNRNAADAVAALDGENPVPASLVINLTDPKDVESVAGDLIADKGFEKVADDADDPASSVQYGRETVERLFSVTYYLRIAAIALVVMLAFIAFVFIDHDFADIEILQNALKSIDCRIGYMIELFLGQVRNINLHGSRLIIFFHDGIRQFDVLGSMFFNQVFICHDDSSLTKILRGCLEIV